MREEPAWLNPYNHDAWEYLVQVAEECARRGFREIQFDYVRFPTVRHPRMRPILGSIAPKKTPSQAFWPTRRPRLEAVGRVGVGRLFRLGGEPHDDVGMGQKLEKLCQNVDVLCPMVYPSLYGAWSYGIEKPESEAVRHRARRLMTDATEASYRHRSEGPALPAGGRRQAGRFHCQSGSKAQIKAAEDLGFNEWVLWGGYLEEGLRIAGRRLLWTGGAHYGRRCDEHYHRRAGASTVGQ